MLGSGRWGSRIWPKQVRGPGSRRTWRRSRCCVSLQVEDRPAIPPGKSVLARWGSWGAQSLWQILDEDRPEYAEDRDRLRGLLSEQLVPRAPSTIGRAVLPAADALTVLFPEVGGCCSRKLGTVCSKKAPSWAPSSSGQAWPRCTRPLPPGVGDPRVSEADLVPGRRRGDRPERADVLASGLTRRAHDVATQRLVDEGGS